MNEKYQLILKNSTILLVEDDPNLKESFKRILLLYVREVLCANDGIEALYLFHNQSIDIIITDIKMPRMSGLDFIKKVRTINQTVPIVVQSAYTDQEFLLESIKLSLIEYVIKPIKENKLDEILINCAKHLQKHKLKSIAINKAVLYDYDKKVLIENGIDVILTSKEIEFIELLLAHQGSLVQKEYLEDKMYIFSEAPPSALKNLVFKLRKKLQTNIIETVGKLGYKIS